MGNEVFLYKCIEWLHVVDSLKLQVSFAKEPYKKRRYSAKETYDFKEPTNRRHPIVEYYHTLQCIATRTAIHRSTPQHTARHYGVATDSRIDQIIGLFCRIMSLLQGFLTKETYNFIDPTDQSQTIGSPQLSLTKEDMGWLRLAGSLKLQVSFTKISSFL